MTTTRISPAWERRLNNGVRWCLRHWLLIVNTLLLVFAGLPWLAPLAQAAGYPVLGQLLFALYRPLCHQRPERSFFIYGYQVAYCHRDVALYTSLLAGGLVFGLARQWIRPAPLRVGGLLLLPILLDGGMHLIEDVLTISLRGGGDAIGSLNFWLRMVTGVLAALAVLITVHPRLDRDLRNQPDLVAS
jgi:uncharacterized membrane protein